MTMEKVLLNVVLFLEITCWKLCVKVMGIILFGDEQNVSCCIAPGSSYWKPKSRITKELNILRAVCRGV